MKIVIADPINVSEQVKERLKELGADIYDDQPDEQQLIERIADAEIITSNYADIPKAVIDAAPKLKYIIVTAVGYDWVDSAYAASKGIKVLNCPTWCVATVAELALGLMLAVQRNIAAAHASLSSGSWEPREFIGTDLHGSTLGMIGYGKIGKKIAGNCGALGMDVSYVNSKSTDADWEALLKNADVVCMCLPGNDATKHILSSERIALMKESAIVVNVGRGATIDTEALMQALKDRKIAGAGLDVYEDEPLSGGTPNKAIQELANLPNVVAVPHIGSASNQAYARIGDEMLANIESCIAQNPQNVVN